MNLNGSDRSSLRLVWRSKKKNLLGAIVSRSRNTLRDEGRNGPEFVGEVLDVWAHLKGVTLDFSRPGKPTDISFEDAQKELKAWQIESNEWHLHWALGYMAPKQFAAS